MFYTWEVSGCPCTFSMPPVCFYAPVYVCMPLGVYTPPYVPILCASVCSQRLLHVVGGCKGSPYMLDTPFTPPLYGGAYPFSLHPLCSFVGFPVHQYVLGISLCHMGNISLMFGVWGYFPSCWGFGGHQHMGCPYAYSCTFL